MNYSYSNDFQNGDNVFQGDEDYIDFEGFEENDMMRYENDERK